MTLLHTVLFRDNRDSEGCTFVTDRNVIKLTVRVIGPWRWDQQAVSKCRSYPRKAKTLSAEPP